MTSEDEIAINIILDWTDAQNPIFVEIEIDSGKSIRIGKHIKRKDGLHSIRIKREDLV